MVLWVPGPDGVVGGREAVVEGIQGGWWEGHPSTMSNGAIAGNCQRCHGGLDGELERRGDGQEVDVDVVSRCGVVRLTACGGGCTTVARIPGNDSQSQTTYSSEGGKARQHRLN